MIEPLTFTRLDRADLPITESDPLGRVKVYSAAVSCALGDMLDIRGQIVVTNDTGDVAMLGAVILVDGKRPPGAKPQTINVTPDMHHAFAVPFALWYCGKIGAVTVQLQAWSYSTARRAAGGVLKVEDLGGLTIVRHTT